MQNDLQMAKKYVTPNEGYIDVNKHCNTAISCMLKGLKCLQWLDLG